MTTAREMFGLQEAFASQVGANPAAVRKKALWQERGERYMRKHNVPSHAMVSPDPSVQLEILGLIEEAFPAVAEAFNRELVPVAKKAFDDWPKDTGVSKSMLGLEFAVEGSEGTMLRGTLFNRAWYAMFITQPKGGVPKERKAIDVKQIRERKAANPPAGGTRRKRRGKSVVNELVWKPGQEAANRMVPLIAELLE